ncbi:SusC/RagA family TonB-linked outer membrane protein [Pedobacter endophyticus]|uniref:SusC/RagA family TonB-linked outer membrane protein n=1 Tax=Pedobacter endophyticus TaxID=2789740 RepID=A0A7S9Q163_9SPHI|nr:SusC/RagA family TonB-linked outer membrane protein [Pedobacter endophyticus]QPH41481.1 SusC/RagA family TonB-linked outer membrane protein [Pedobacter endophyticus]
MYKNFTRKVMRLTAVIFCATLMQVSAATFGQRISLNYKQAPLTEVLKKICRAAGHDILFDQRIAGNTKPVDISVSGATVEEALNIALTGQRLTFSIKDKTVMIVKAKEGLLDKIVSYFDEITVRGRVIDNEGKPMPGATIVIKNTKRLVKTDANGEFIFPGVEENSLLLISYIGFETKEVRAVSKLGDVKLEVSINKLENVVVTGMFERKKESFTGSTKTVTGHQLREIGNQNVIEALKTLDPSFIVVENNLNGADPNALARIELRGKTSITKNLNSGALVDQFSVDPNTPLFILDGFESTLRQITDLDINRIASVTLLKDAASTALYGARSANGVVVVETIKPKPGQLRVNYTGDFRVSAADLSDYNLMNAEEKLEFEKLSGRFEARGQIRQDYVMLERFYNQRLATVRQGVNTYWLNEPIHAAAFTQNHSIYATGGSQEFQYGVGVNLQDIGGLMKGSERKNWGARADLTYRKGKLNITNRIFLSGNRSDESPYGSFSTYAKINPYYKRGITDRYLEQIPSGHNARSLANVDNPLYNAQLNSEKYSNSLILQNNLGFIFNLNKAIRFTGGLQLSKITGTAVEFISPLNTKFDNVALLEKGSYKNSRNEAFNYTGNLAFSYNKVIDEKHVLTGNARGEVQGAKNNTIGLTAVGFPTGVAGNPGFANSYLPDARPLVSTPPQTRRINALASINYVYDNRYFFDATYRIDGSTAFGSAKRYSPFWATGIGWRLNNEQFMKPVDWINSLIIRANIGTSGNQSFGSFASATVYNLEAYSNYFGQGLYHTSLGNPNLDWQKTLQSSAGIEMGLFQNRLSATLDFYNKFTNPLIATIDLPGSNGISGYPINAGNMNIKGLEANLKYSPVFNLDKRIIWTLGLTGSMYKSIYGGFNGLLDGLNAEQQRSNSIQRYSDGHSPDDLWAYRSLGIDPSTGRELFLKANGNYTFEYASADIMVVANARPKAEGVISSSLRIKAFTFNAYIRYSLGSSRFNNALYEKVENIDFGDLSFNQDKRALELRWKKPGDIAQFKAIADTEITPISSRFIQKENILTGESISVGYELQSSSTRWLKSAHLQSLRLSAFMNNIFRVSNIVAERGIDYPFANTVSFSINASF